MAQVAQAAVGASARPWLRVWKVPSSGSSGGGVRWVVVRWLAHPWGRLEVRWRRVLMMRLFALAGANHLWLCSGEQASWLAWAARHAHV